MRLIIATGSNIGDRLSHLNEAKSLLKEKFNLIEASRVYESPAVDYLNQPDFYNQVLHFETDITSPEEILKYCQKIENELGRTRIIDKGPRTIDIDILFLNEEINTEYLQVPHPRLFQRSFVVLPLRDLQIYSTLEKEYTFQTAFENDCWPIVE